MLDKLRRVGYDKKPSRFKSIMMFIVFGIICVVFIFMVMPGPMGSFVSGGNAASVNGEIISIAEFENAFKGRYRQVSSFLEQMSKDQRESMTKTMRRNILNELVNQEVSYQSLQDEAFYAAPKEILDQIAELEYFKVDGEFSRSKYFQVLENARLKPAKFEASIEKDMVRSKAMRAFFSSALPSVHELEAKENLKNLKFDVEFIRFRDSQLKSKIAPTSTEVADYVSKNEQALKTTYESKKSDYKTEDEVKARHILVKIPPEDKDGAKTLKKINEIKEKIKKGEDFAALAKEFSEDPGSKNKGGDLGYFSRGRMVKPFENVAFALEKNKLSEPVKSNFGYHLIEVLDKKQGRQKPYDEVKSDIARNELKTKMFDEQMANLEASLQGKKIEEVTTFLNKHNLKWDSTGPFSLDGGSVPKLGAAKDVVDQALGQPTGELSSSVIKSGGQNYLVKLKSTKMETAKGSDVSNLPAEKLYEKLESEAQKRYTKLFSQWVEDQKKSLRVKMNDKIL